MAERNNFPAEEGKVPKYECESEYNLEECEFVVHEDMLDNADIREERTAALIKLCHNLLSSDHWKVEKITSEGDIISSIVLSGQRRKIFKITGIIHLGAAKLLDDTYDNIESSPTWNHHVEESERIRKIDENTDIIYQAAKSFGNGLIGARDFVILRHRSQYGDYFICSNISVDLKEVPERKNFIRGRNHVGCFATRNLKDDSAKDRCEYTWILDTDMKGWIPQKLVDMCKSVGLISFMKSLRTHVEVINANS